jgi:hypothetical protein
MVKSQTAPWKRWRATTGPDHQPLKRSDTVTDSNDSATPETPVKTPRSVKRVAAIGIPISLAAAAAVSFAGLTKLGGYAGIERPWLMPVAIDVYATTATLIAMLLPEGHRARTTAVWHARLGLAMSMSGNALARALHLGPRGYTASDALLTFVGTWPSLIVERLLQLQGQLVVVDATDAAAVAPAAALLRDEPERHPMAPLDAGAAATDTPPEDATDTPQAPPASASGTPHAAAASATRKRQRQPGTVTEMAASGGLSEAGWVEVAAPVYLELMERDGKAPTAPKLIDELVRRGSPSVGSARARVIRKATEDSLGLTKDPGEDPEPEDETLEEAG